MIQSYDMVALEPFAIFLAILESDSSAPIERIVTPNRLAVSVYIDQTEIEEQLKDYSQSYSCFCKLVKRLIHAGDLEPSHP